MEIKSYKIYNGHVDLVLTDGKVVCLRLNDDTGKILYRYKINTISQVKHPGVALGIDQRA
jgi:hypothetical protein